MTMNYTPLDIASMRNVKSHAVSRVSVALFTIATLTVLVFAATFTVVMRQRAMAQDTITLPPQDLTVSPQGN